jgi:ABC-type transport system involved in cytochrome bd biosynthesis fused ATPase/permease subunit
MKKTDEKSRKSKDFTLKFQPNASMASTGSSGKGKKSAQTTPSAKKTSSKTSGLLTPKARVKKDPTDSPNSSNK